MRSDNEEKVHQQNAINPLEKLLSHCNETINKGLCRTTKPFVKRCCSFVGKLVDVCVKKDRTPKRHGGDLQSKDFTQYCQN